MADVGFIDPDGQFTVIAVNALVMVVDKKRLGNLPVPQTWRDLLNPLYEKQVVIRGQGDTFCDIVHLNSIRIMAMQELLDLRRRFAMDFTRLRWSRSLAASANDVPPIHVMPRFFAETISDRENIESIWPKDGVLAYPISLLVKDAKIEKLRGIVDFFTGADVARIFDDALFPALHLDAGQHLSPDAKFKWLGWDYVRNCDIEVLTEELNCKFLQARCREGEASCK